MPDATAEEAGWRRYRKRPLIVEGRGPLTSPEIIVTLEGTMRAEVGDYVIRGTRSELYPCKPAVFADVYELVDESPS